MKLKDDLQVNADFILVHQQIWQKLLHTFGGAPEINIFLINKSNNSGNAQGEAHSEEVPDLSPITIDILSLEQTTLNTNSNKVGIIVSPYIGSKVFLNYICPLMNYAPTKITLFHIISVDADHEDLEEIKVKGNNTQLLVDYGIKEGSRVVIIQDTAMKSRAKVYNDI